MQYETLHCLKTPSFGKHQFCQYYGSHSGNSKNTRIYAKCRCTCFAQGFGRKGKCWRRFECKVEAGTCPRTSKLHFKLERGCCNPLKLGSFIINHLRSTWIWMILYWKSKWNAHPMTYFQLPCIQPIVNVLCRPFSRYQT